MNSTTPTSARRQRVCILGATGSVGTNTLDVISRHPERFEVFALTAHSRVDELFEQCVRWRPRFAALGDARGASALRERLQAHDLRTEVLSGPTALSELAAHPDVDAAVRRQREHFEVLRVAGDHVQRVHADGAGRAEDADALAAGCRCRRR